MTGVAFGGLRLRAGLGWALFVLLVTAALALRYFPAALPGLVPSRYWWMAAASIVVLVVSVLLHELAHAAIAAAYGVRSRGITFLLLGARTEIAGMLPHPRAEALMAAAGPGANLVVGLALGIFLPLFGDAEATPARSVLEFGVLANVLLAIINALPVFPLDGGRIVRAWLWLRTGRLDGATRRASMIGVVASAIVCLAGAAVLAIGREVEGMLALSVGIYLYARARSVLARGRVHASRSPDDVT